MNNSTIEDYKTLHLSLQAGNTYLIKQILNNGLSLGNDKAEIEKTIANILLQAPNGKVKTLGCYDEDIEDNYIIEGFNPEIEAKKLLADYLYKTTNLQNLDSTQRIPFITHQIYITPTNNPKPIDHLSLKISIKTTKMLNNAPNSWQHNYWTNNLDSIPNEIKNIPNVRIRLIDELKDSILWPELERAISLGDDDISMIVTASDMIRIIVTEMEGGIYHDLDYQLYDLEGLLEIIKYFDFISGREIQKPEAPPLICNAFFASIANHPIFKKTAEQIKRNYDQNIDNLPQYIQFPCSKSTSIVYKAGSYALTMAYFSESNKNGRVDVVTPNEIFFNVLYAHYITSESMCYSPHKPANLTNDINGIKTKTIGADTGCGSWNKSRSNDMIFYQKNIDLYLFEAANHGYAPIVKYLIDNGANVDFLTKGVTAIYMAAENGHFEAVEILIKSGANLEIKAPTNNRTPLGGALFDGHYDIINLLMKHGAKVGPLNLKISKKDAEANGYTYIAKYFSDIDLSMATQSKLDLKEALEKQDTQLAKQIINNGFNLGKNKAEIEQTIANILLQAPNGKVKELGCYDGDSKEFFVQEEIDYSRENKKLIEDALYKLTHLDDLNATQRIPFITHQVYITSSKNSKPIHPLSLKISINTTKMLNDSPNNWQHNYWTNNLDSIPDEIKNIPNVRIRLIDELKDSILWPELKRAIKLGENDISMIIAASDIARLIIPYKEGGLYHDLDYQLYDLDELLKIIKYFDFMGGIESVTRNNNADLVGNAFFASRANHPILYKAIELAKKNYNQNNDSIAEYIKFACSKSSSIIYKSGSFTLTIAYFLEANKNDNIDISTPNSVFFNYPYAHYITKESVCYKPDKVAYLTNYINGTEIKTAGADTRCGSWHKSNFGDMIFYQKNINLYLFEAAKYGYAPIVKYLIDNGANIDFPTKGITSIYMAAENGHFEVVEFLIKAGANLEIKAPNSRTPLGGALFDKHYNIINLLMEYGANVHNLDLKISIEDAKTHGYMNIAKYLGENSIDEVVSETIKPIETAKDSTIFSAIKSIIKKTHELEESIKDFCSDNVNITDYIGICEIFDN